MGLQEAINNWRNFGRMAVGKPPIHPVKVVRNGLARMFPIMQVKKDGDVGYDIPSIEPVVIPAHGRAQIPTGVRFQMPMNIWATIEARSGTSSKLMITPDSIIDAGYRGELFAVIFNLGDTDYVVDVGERLVQVIFHQRILVDLEDTDRLEDSERGESGFGSTGQMESYR